MPIYEYRCNACGHLFEEWQGIHDAPVSVCPSCSEEKVEKLMSVTSFLLKGGGWYADGYASAKQGDSEKTTAPQDATKSPSKNGSPSESKSKSESKSESQSKPSSGSKPESKSKADSASAAS